MPYLDTTGLDALWGKVKTAITTAVNGKQDKLTAGANITISNNVISATASGTGIGYKVYNGTTVVNFKNDSSYGYIAPMFSKSEMKAIIGRDWDDERDVMLCMNGDWNAQPNLSGLTASHADSGNSHTSYKNFFCTAAYASTGAVRINYVIIAKES